MANNYIMKWRHVDDRMGTRIWFTGPFETMEEACEWARLDQAADGDDPEWQAVTLPLIHAGEASVALAIEAPRAPATLAA